MVRIFLVATLFIVGAVLTLGSWIFFVLGVSISEDVYERIGESKSRWLLMIVFIPLAAPVFGMAVLPDLLREKKGRTGKEEQSPRSILRIRRSWGIGMAAIIFYYGLAYALGGYLALAYGFLLPLSLVVGIASHVEQPDRNSPNPGAIGEDTSTNGS